MLNDNKLSTYDALVFAVIDTLNNGFVTISVDQIRTLIGVEQDVIKGSIINLKDKGYITVKGFTSNDTSKIMTVTVNGVGQAPVKKDIVEINETADERTETERYVEITKKVITHLNSMAGKSYRPSTTSYQRLVYKLLDNDYTEEDILKVIDFKCQEWKGTNQAKYLQPTTLFADEHFDTYLNEVNNKGLKVNQQDKYKVDENKENVTKGW